MFKCFIILIYRAIFHVNECVTRIIKSNNYYADKNKWILNILHICMHL